jgi:hypothetical protein
VNALNTCKQHLAKPKQSSDELSPDEISGVFASFAYFHFHHKRFLDALRERVSLWNETTTVGDLFLENSRLFGGYVNYCRQYAGALARLHTVISLRKPLRQSRLLRLGDLQTAESLDSTLEQYVMLPTQRLPQYMFVLMNLFRYTAKTHGDYGLLHQALTETRTAVEEIMRVIDAEATPHTHKLLSIATSIEGREAELLVVPQRRFVREGVLASVSFTSRTSSLSGASTTTVRKPHVFMFEDLIVCCEQGARDPDKAFMFVAQLEIADIRAIHVNHALIIELSLHLGILRGSAVSPVAPTSPSQVNMLSWVMRALKEDDRFQWESEISRLVDQARLRYRRNTGSSTTTPRPRGFLQRTKSQAIAYGVGAGGAGAGGGSVQGSGHSYARQPLQTQSVRIHNGSNPRPRIDVTSGSAGAEMGVSGTVAVSAPLISRPVAAMVSPRLPHVARPNRPQPPPPPSSSSSLSSRTHAASAALPSPLAPLATKTPVPAAPQTEQRPRIPSYSEGSATADEGAASGTPVAVRNRQPSYDMAAMPRTEPIAPPPPSATTVLGTSLAVQTADFAGISAVTPSATETTLSDISSTSTPPTPLKEERPATAVATATEPRPIVVMPTSGLPPAKEPFVQLEWRDSNMLVVYDVARTSSTDSDHHGSDAAVAPPSTTTTTQLQPQPVLL